MNITGSSIAIVEAFIRKRGEGTFIGVTEGEVRIGN